MKHTTSNKLWDLEGNFYCRNNSSPGLGKTYGTMEYVSESVEVNNALIKKTGKGERKRWLIIAPQHKLIEGEGNILDMLKGDVAHLKGKNHFPEFFDEDRCYLEGCGKCKHVLQCGYKRQHWNADIVVCPYEMLYVVDRSQFHGLVIEEDPSRIVFKSMVVNPDYFTLEQPKKVEYLNTEYTFYNVKSINIDNPTTINEWRIWQFKIYDDIFINEYKGVYYLHGYNPINLYNSFNKVIFNCATTPRSYEQYIFNRTLTSVITEDEHELQNPIISITGSWNKATTESNILPMQQMLLNIKLQLQLNNKDGNIFMVTKKKFEPNFEDYCDIVHYGSGRGFNTFNKEYDLAIIYGGFYRRPIDRLILMQFGVKESTILKLESSEVIQCMHRCRPFINESTPFLLLTNRIYENSIWSTVPKKTLKTYANYPLPNENEISGTKLIKDYGLSRNTAYGLNTFVRWLRTFVFLQPTNNERIKSYRVGHTTKETAKFFNISTKTVQRINRLVYVAPQKERKINENSK